MIRESGVPKPACAAGERGGFPVREGSVPLPESPPRHIWRADVATRPGSASQMGDERQNPCTGFKSCNFSLEICVSRLVARTPHLRGCRKIPVQGWAIPCPAPPSRICALNPAPASHGLHPHPTSYVLRPASRLCIPNPASAPHALYLASFICILNPVSRVTCPVIPPPHPKFCFCAPCPAICIPNPVSCASIPNPATVLSSRAVPCTPHLHLHPEACFCSPSPVSCVRVLCPISGTLRLHPKSYITSPIP